MKLPYTICFCCYQQQVLMLYRTFQPNAQRWNGLGGKIEAGETPFSSVKREVQEEAGINLEETSSLYFAGIVTWGLVGHEPEKGMYAFIAHLSQQQARRVHSLHTPEGFITWKPLAWVCDPNNQAVVSNIPHFLPPMLKTQHPYEYFYGYKGEGPSTETFPQLTIRSLPSYIVLSECQA